MRGRGKSGLDKVKLMISTSNGLTEADMSHCTGLSFQALITSLHHLWGPGLIDFKLAEPAHCKQHLCAPRFLLGKQRHDKSTSLCSGSKRVYTGKQ